MKSRNSLFKTFSNYANNPSGNRAGELQFAQAERNVPFFFCDFFRNSLIRSVGSKLTLAQYSADHVLRLGLDQTGKTTKILN